VRVSRVIARVCADGGTSLLVSHGRTLRALAAQWITGTLRLGSALALEPATISILQRDRSGPQVRLWGFSPVGLPCP
jgi:broad specificity phosphatase PhoE